MSVVATVPGRHGDILWALPTVRAIAAVHGPVTLVTTAKYGRGLAPLLEAQGYIRGVEVLESWQVEETAPMTPRRPRLTPLAFRDDTVVHLGYRAWPRSPLPTEVWTTLREEHPTLEVAPIAFDPWITAPGWTTTDPAATPVVYGFTDEHFELKFGLVSLLRLHDRVSQGPRSTVLCAPGSRWHLEGQFYPTNWAAAARQIAEAEVFVGCCSALHVLAVALGVPAVVMEPAPARHHAVFWPMNESRVSLVVGTDAQWTWDARHVREARDQRLGVTR